MLEEAAQELQPRAHRSVARAALGAARGRIVRPIVFVLTLPITILTLGLFLLVLNAAMIGLVAMFLGGFQVDGLIAGVLAAVVTGLVSWLGHALVKEPKRG